MEVYIKNGGFAVWDYDEVSYSRAGQSTHLAVPRLASQPGVFHKKAAQRVATDLRASAFDMECDLSTLDGSGDDIEKRLIETFDRIGVEAAIDAVASDFLRSSTPV